jgi:para-nitrobenzyl esterase
VTLDTTYGPVIGETVDGVTIFRTVPFAAPPVGALRFSNPVPPTPWTAPRDARGLPPPCPQLKFDGGLFIGQEDCLYLSVFAPVQPAGAPPLPVMVWIYGGAYILGDEWELGWYDGAALARTRNVIVITLNYRVGPFGFFASDALAAEPANGGGTGNAALLDQVAALEWVRDNAARVGGDAARVTIFGESAGAFSVAWLIASPRAAGLFSAAISESGSFDTPQFFQPRADAVNFNAVYAAALDCAGDSAAQLACMRAHSAEHVMLSLADALNPNWPDVGPPGARVRGADLVGSLPATLRAAAARGALPALAPLMPWGPAIDGVALLDTPLASVRAGKFNKVPVVLGSNKDDGSIFVPVMTVILPGVAFPPRETDIPLIIEHAFNMYDSALVRNLTAAIILPAYPAAAFVNDTWARATAMITNAVFTCGARRAARALTAQGAPVYLYQFSHKLDFIENDLIPGLGTYHTSEISFVFGNAFPSADIHPWTPVDADVRDAMGAWWTQFAVAHDPNGADPNASAAPLVWPRFGAAASGIEESLQIEVPFSITGALDEYVCDNAWDPFYAALEQSGRV